MSNFAQRALTGALFVIVLVSAIWFGPWPALLLFLLISLLAVSEFYQLVRLTNHRPQYFYGMLATALVYSLVAFSGVGEIRLTYLWLLFPLAIVSFFIELFRKTHQPSGNISLTVLGLLYIPLSFALLFWISTYSSYRGLTEYRPWPVLGLFILIWLSDTGAYLAGKAFGKHKLFERISPGKTWEGFLGGTVLTLLAAYFMADLDLHIRQYQWWGLALIVQVTGTLGDLSQSMLKRSVGVKDSGNILPGHGGLLDRFDAALAVIPFAAAFLYLSA